MKIAICDDEKIFRNTLKEYLNKYSQEYFYNFLYTEYSDGLELLSDKSVFDLIFMDYQMKNINGIDTIDVLRKRNNKTTVVFISSYKDVVFDSLKVQTYRFLVKPLSKDKLYEALDSFIIDNANNEYVVVVDEINDKKCRLLENEIIYAEADNMYTQIRTHNGFYIFKNTLSNFAKEIKSDFFYRTHRSFIVNFNYITTYTHSEICFENGEKASLTKSKYMNFQKSYFTFLKRKTIGENNDSCL